MKKSVIFDIDGTMWDATAEICAAWNQMLSENGYAQRDVETVKGCMGKPMDEVFRILIPDAKADEFERMRSLCESYEVEYLKKSGPSVYEGTEEMLIKLNSVGIGCYIVTNAQDGYTESFLQRSGLGKYFEDYESFGRTGLQKSDNIKTVMERNGLDRSVYFGDTEADYISSKKAGIPFIHAKYGFGGGFDCEYSVDSPKELYDTVCGIFNGEER